VLSTLLFTAVAGLAAPPTFATDYFVKYLNSTSSTQACNFPPVPLGARHGSVVFKRTATEMFATVYLRNVSPNTEYYAYLIAKGGPTCFILGTLSFPTDSSGNATVQRGPLSRQGKQSFWVHVSKKGGGEDFRTAPVPAFGF
jgi:hypothetical protein